jgi:UDP-glucose 4-epimerase
MRTHGIQKLIFSSSCAVYGNPSIVPIPESCTHNPISPYGATKAMIERILADGATAYGIQYVALRYFNVAGMKPGSLLYEYHQPETHLIPRALEAAHYGKPFTVFGNDYATPDGTCVRDFLHVLDVARAHYDALVFIEKTHASSVFNLGTGTGSSVRQIVTALEAATGTSLAIVHAARRSGDPAQLIADNTKALSELGWRPAHSSLSTIIKSAHEGYTCMLGAHMPPRQGELGHR